MTSCPCGSGRGYDECCGPLLAGGAVPSPEALMRSRYTAFTRADLDYLETTLAPEAKEDYNREETETWVKNAKWNGLEVRNSAVEGDTGTVEFVAHYKFQGKVFAHHELGSFRQHEGRWVYVDGIMNPRPAQRVVDNKVGRNDPCPCGSGKKYKKCCGA
ncbi:MAG TPA: YchJ family protein [Magnetospirillum sp.]|jgi:SEC-C motif-containing protein|nr:YchJ family protein [Magnetospirillum sp.]